MGWNVKGIVFLDYVRMIRSRKDVDWRKHLKAEDFPFLTAIIQPEQWYPMETFERMGLGIFTEIANGDVQSVYMWGRFAMDDLFRLHKTLIANGNPLESLMRFQVLRRSFFDFNSIEIKSLMGNRAIVEVNYNMDKTAEEASSYQTAGFLERLVELSGAKKTQFQFLKKTWAGDPVTAIQLDWE